MDYVLPSDSCRSSILPFDTAFQLFHLQVDCMAKKKAPKNKEKSLPTRSQDQDTSAAELSSQPSLQAMVWYKEEHYPELLKLFDDADLLPPKYQDWLTRAEEKKAEVEAAGDQVMKVFIDPQTFLEWCDKKNLPKDASARTELALEVAQARSFSL
jgi:hypothetical protein